MDASTATAVRDKTHHGHMTKTVQKWATCIVFFVLGGCLSDETPADIHRKIVPQIAQELIQSQHSDRLTGLPLHAQVILKKNSAHGVSFAIGAPELSSETGIRFYTKKDTAPFLIIGLDLNSSGNGYIVSRVSEGELH